MKTRGSELGAGATDRRPNDEKVRDDVTSQLEEARRRLESLRAKVGQFQTRDPARQRRQIEALDLQHDAIRDDVLELRQKKGTAWEALKVRIERALEELESGLQSFQDELSGEPSAEEQE